MFKLGKVERYGARPEHRLLGEAGLVRVDEKIDGSQIQFGVFGGELRIESKSREQSVAAPDKMFQAAIDSVVERKDLLSCGRTYMGEYLMKPHHNVLTYDRVPEGHIVLFDVVDHEGQTYGPITLREEAEAVHLEVVQFETMPALDAIRIGQSNPQYFKSMLGGPSEGIVVKTMGALDTRIVAKFVSDQFKEVKGDRTTRNIANPAKNVAVTMANKYCPSARFLKAVQRLKEEDLWTGSMKDIPKIREYVARDLTEECAEDIKAELYELYRKEIQKSALRPIAAWYEQYLFNDNAFWTTRGE
jgi:hypothetical protein